MLTKNDILDIDDTESETVNVPEWGGDVLVSVMTGFSRDSFEASLVGKKGGENLSNIRAKLAAYTLIDEKGEQLFSEKDIARLGKKSGSALNRVYEVAIRINKISDADVDELAKN